MKNGTYGIFDETALLLQKGLVTLILFPFAFSNLLLFQRFPISSWPITNPIPIAIPEETPFVTSLDKYPNNIHTIRGMMKYKSRLFIRDLSMLPFPDFFQLTIV